MVGLTVSSKTLLTCMYHRANKSNEINTPSKPSLSVVQNLSELRLTHARLFEEHGATSAILRSRETELAKTQESLSDAQSMITALRAEVRGLKDMVTRRDQRTQLAERELGFLQALVVCILLVCQPCVSHLQYRRVIPRRKVCGMPLPLTVLLCNACSSWNSRFMNIKPLTTSCKRIWMPWMPRRILMAPDIRARNSGQSSSCKRLTLQRLPKVLRTRHLVCYSS